VVIGNHDVFGGVHVPEDIFAFPRRCRETPYERKVEEFREHFHEAFQNSFFASPLDPFPYGKVVGHVLLVGVNTVAPYSRLRNPLGSNGEVGEEQFRRLQMILASDVFRKRQKIILAHHHFSKSDAKESGSVSSVWDAIERQTMKLHGKKPLCRLFEANDVELVLHGHLHRSVEYRRKGVRFLNGGGSILGPVPGELGVNIVTVRDREIEVEIERVSGTRLRKRELVLPAPADDVPAHAAA
jgi:3',5'-cyclic AMP phosphodiesterase CpdA